MVKKLTCLLLIALLFTGCFEDEPANTPEDVFENLYQNFVESYGPTTERNIDWPMLYARYSPEVHNGMSDEELYDVITEMLSNLNDGHVGVTAPDRPAFNSNYLRNNHIDDDLFNKSVIKTNYLASGFQEGDGYFYGKIKDENIGYIWFDYVAENFFVLNDFLAANASSIGIIIDMRHNQGGDFTYGFSSMGRLTETERFVFQSRTKTGKGPGDFTAWYRWSIEPEGSYFDKPIILLTDRYTISAGERTVMALQTLPNVKTIGDTTCGALSTMIGRELANGWYYTIPTQNTLFADDKTYEGIGMPPNIYFKNLQSDVNMGLDKTLQRAIDEL